MQSIGFGPMYDNQSKAFVLLGEDILRSAFHSDMGCPVRKWVFSPTGIKTDVEQESVRNLVNKYTLSHH